MVYDVPFIAVMRSNKNPRTTNVFYMHKPLLRLPYTGWNVKYIFIPLYRMVWHKLGTQIFWQTCNPAIITIGIYQEVQRTWHFLVLWHHKWCKKQFLRHFTKQFQQKAKRNHSQVTDATVAGAILKTINGKKLRGVLNINEFSFSMNYPDTAS